MEHLPTLQFTGICNWYTTSYNTHIFISICAKTYHVLEMITLYVSPISLMVSWTLSMINKVIIWTFFLWHHLHDRTSHYQQLVIKELLRTAGHSLGLVYRQWHRLSPTNTSPCLSHLSDSQSSCHLHPSTCWLTTWYGSIQTALQVELLLLFPSLSNTI